MTDTAITIGVQYLSTEDLNALGAALGGGTDSDSGDQLGAAKAIVKYINAHGGIAGRKLKPVYSELDLSGEWPAAYQSSCETFTSDNKVFAVASESSAEGWEVLASCLAKRKTVMVRSSGIRSPAVDKQQIDSFAPYFYWPDTLGGERWGIAIDMLHQAGYFEKDAKIGVLWWRDDSDRRTLDGPITQRLAHYGLKISAEGSFTAVRSNNDIAAITREGQQYALRFQQEGITHVLALATHGAAGFAFGHSAEGQDYRPRWGTVFDICGPKPQCNRALGVDWSGIIGDESALAPGGPPNDEKAWAKHSAAYRLCFRIIKDAGIGTPSAARGRFMGICETLFFVRTVLNRVSEVTPAGFRAAVDTLGNAFTSVSTFSTQFKPGRYAGVNEVRLMAYLNDCECYRWTGKRLRAP